MTTTLLSTTNSNADEIVGKECKLHIDMTASFTFDATDCNFDLRHGRYSTSTIEKIEYNEVSRHYYEISISTRNSVYVFSKGTKSNIKPLTSDELLALQMAFFV